MRVQRVAPVEAGEESWTVLGDDWRQVVPVEQFLAHLTDQGRSPNTGKAYAHDLKDYFEYLTGRALGWDRLRYDELAAFKPWLRLSPAARRGEISVLPATASACSESTINRKLSAVTSFYEFHRRHGVEMALTIRDASRPVASTSTSFRPFLAHVKRSRPRRSDLRLRESSRRPMVLSDEQVPVLVEECDRLRDRVLLGLLDATGLRIGEALGHRHEDIRTADPHVRHWADQPRSAARGRQAASRLRQPGDVVALRPAARHDDPRRVGGRPRPRRRLRPPASDRCRVGQPGPHSAAERSLRASAPAKLRSFQQVPALPGVHHHQPRLARPRGAAQPHPDPDRPVRAGRRQPTGRPEPGRAGTTRPTDEQIKRQRRRPTMPAEPGAALAESARRRHQNAIDSAHRALRAARASGQQVTYANIAAAAGVSRSWLYTQPEIRAAIERLRDDNGRSAAAPVPSQHRASAASLVRRLEAAHRRNQELSREVAELRDQLAAAHGELRAARRRPVDSSVVDLSHRRANDQI